LQQIKCRRPDLPDEHAGLQSLLVSSAEVASSVAWTAKRQALRGVARIL
jgi:hypothetical protein